MQFTETTPIERGFASVFETQIKPKLLALEDDRKAALRRFYRNILLAVCAGAAVLVLIRVVAGPDRAMGFSVLVLGCVALAVWYFWSSAEDGWTAAVADVTMPAVCAHVGDLRYAQSGAGFPIATFRMLALLPKYDRASLSNQLSGIYHTTKFEMTHAHLTEKNSGSNSNSSTTVFQGLLFRIAVPAPVPGRIVLMQDRGDWGNKLAETFSFGTSRAMPKVTFDDPAFEAAFEVYSDQPAAARRFMPLAFRDALLQIGAEQGRGARSQPLVAGFEGQSFYMALRRHGTFLTMGSIMTPVTHIEPALHKIFRDVALCYDVIDRLHGV